MMALIESSLLVLTIVPGRSLWGNISESACEYSGWRHLHKYQFHTNKSSLVLLSSSSNSTIHTSHLKDMRREELYGVNRDHIGSLNISKNKNGSFLEIEPGGVVLLRGFVSLGPVLDDFLFYFSRVVGSEIEHVVEDVGEHNGALIWLTCALCISKYLCSHLELPIALRRELLKRESWVLLLLLIIHNDKENHHKLPHSLSTPFHNPSFSQNNPIFLQTYSQAAPVKTSWQVVQLNVSAALNQRIVQIIASVYFKGGSYAVPWDLNIRDKRRYHDFDEKETSA